MLTRLNDHRLKTQPVNYKDVTPPLLKKLLRKPRPTKPDFSVDPQPEALPFTLYLKPKSKHLKPKSTSKSSSKSSEIGYPSFITIPFKNHLHNKACWIQWCNKKSPDQNSWIKTCEDIPVYVNHVKSVCTKVLNDSSLLEEYNHINFEEINLWVDDFIKTAQIKQFRVKAGDVVGTVEPVACGDKIGNDYQVGIVLDVPNTNELEYGWEYKNDRNIKIRLFKRHLLLGKSKQFETWSNDDLHLFSDEEKKLFEENAQHEDEKEDLGILCVSFNEIKVLISSESKISQALAAHEFLFKNKYKSDRILARLYDASIDQYIQEVGSFMQSKIQNRFAHENVSVNSRTFWLLDGLFKTFKTRLKSAGITWSTQIIKKKTTLQFKGFNAQNVEKVMGHGSMMYIHVLSENEDASVNGRLHILGLKKWSVDLDERRMKIKYVICYQKVLFKDRKWKGTSLVSRKKDIPWFTSIDDLPDEVVDKIPLSDPTILKDKNSNINNNINNNNSINNININNSENNNDSDIVVLDKGAIDAPLAARALNGDTLLSVNGVKGGVAGKCDDVNKQDNKNDDTESSNNNLAILPVLDKVSVTGASHDENNDDIGSNSVQKELSININNNNNNIIKNNNNNNKNINDSKFGDTNVVSSNKGNLNSLLATHGINSTQASNFSGVAVGTNSNVNNVNFNINNGNKKKEKIKAVLSNKGISDEIMKFLNDHSDDSDSINCPRNKRIRIDKV